GRVVDLAVERDDVAAGRAQCGQGIAVGPAGRHLLALVPARELEPYRLETVRLGAAVRLRHLDDDVADAAELLDRLRGVVERLAVPARLVLDLLDPFSLERLGDHDGRLPGGGDRFGVPAVDRLDIVAVDLDRVPAARLRAVGVRVEVPALHGL